MREDIVDAEIIGDEAHHTGAMRELDARDITRVPRHTGAFIGFVVMMIIVIATALFCSAFADGRIIEVNGPVAAGITLVVMTFVLAFAKYEAWVLNQSSPTKRSFYTGMSWAAGIGMALSGVVMAATIVYRDQSGGLSLNGVETMFVLGLLTSGCILAQFISTRSLGGLTRKPKVDKE